MVSKLKPQATILGLSRIERTLRAMSILWGVVPKLATEYSNTDDMLNKAVAIAKQNNFTDKGDLVILTAGAGTEGVTNMMKVVEVE